MRNAKIVLGVLLLSLLGLFFYQNRDYFMAKHYFGVNFYFTAYRLPEVSNGLFFLSSLVIGFLLAYFASLVDRFKAAKTIRELNRTVASDQATIASLQNERMSIKGDPPADPGLESGKEPDVAAV